MTESDISSENKEKKYPPLSHACVGAIVYKETSIGREYLIQKRYKPGTSYHNKWEFPVGILEDSNDRRLSAPSQALREIQEEAGLNPESARIITKNKNTYTSPEGDVVEGFTPYYQAHQIVGGNPWYMTTFLVEATPDSKITESSEETREVQWMHENNLRQMLKESTGDFFSLQVPAWQYHFSEDSE